MCPPPTRSTRSSAGVLAHVRRRLCHRNHGRVLHRHRPCGQYSKAVLRRDRPRGEDPDRAAAARGHRRLRLDANPEGRAEATAASSARQLQPRQPHSPDDRLQHHRRLRPPRIGMAGDPDPTGPRRRLAGPCCAGKNRCSAARSTCRTHRLATGSTHQGSNRMQGDLYITGDPDADVLLNTDPFALLMGMLLDQQVPMEWAFASPIRFGTASGGSSRGQWPRCRWRSWRRVQGTPALHRFPVRWPSARSSSASRSWTTTAAGPRGCGPAGRRPGAVRPGARAARLRRREGQDFVAMLGKRFGVRPAGWEDGRDRSPTRASFGRRHRLGRSAPEVRAFKQRRR